MNIINPGPKQRVLPVLFKEPVTMFMGDVYHHTLAGGGGYGDPLERDIALVERDLRQGRITGTGALNDYGVVAAQERLEWVVDIDATLTLRASRRAALEV